MFRTCAVVLALVAALALFAERVEAQHLWWNEARAQKDATCVYGEITVLVTHPAIYYCGANWHPGEPAGGYCGIQHNSVRERRTIFSIWDTSAKLHPKVTQADPKTIFNRFGGEGEGAHTHMLWDWKVGETFQFFVRKQPGARPGTTATRYYLYDRQRKQWRHSATITSPNGDKKSERSVATIGGGGLVSFLENFLGRDKDIPKIALYRLWLGTDVDHLKCLTRATGDGIWGQLHGAYFLAEGDAKKLDAAFAQLKDTYGVPVYGSKTKKLMPIAVTPLTNTLKQQLKNLPNADRVETKKRTTRRSNHDLLRQHGPRSILETRMPERLTNASAYSLAGCVSVQESWRVASSAACTSAGVSSPRTSRGLVTFVGPVRATWV